MYNIGKNERLYLRVQFPILFQVLTIYHLNAKMDDIYLFANNKKCLLKVKMPVQRNALYKNVVKKYR